MRPGSLDGSTIMLTRAVDRTAPWREALEAHGARVVEVPCIATAPADGEALQAALATPADWAALTSPNGVRAVAAALKKAPPPWRRLAVVGPGTAAAAQANGWSVDLQPQQADGMGLAAALLPISEQGDRVLLPRGDLAGADLPAALRRVGLAVEEVVAYKTVADPRLQDRLAAALAKGEPDWVVLASGSAFTHLHAAWPGGLARMRLAAIGPRTAEAIRAAGLDVAAVAQAPTAPALIAALAGR